MVLQVSVPSECPLYIVRCMCVMVVVTGFTQRVYICVRGQHIVVHRWTESVWVAGGYCIVQQVKDVCKCRMVACGGV